MAFRTLYFAVGDSNVGFGPSNTVETVLLHSDGTVTQSDPQVVKVQLDSPYAGLTFEPDVGEICARKTFRYLLDAG